MDTEKLATESTHSLLPHQDESWNDVEMSHGGSSKRERRPWKFWVGVRDVLLYTLALCGMISIALSIVHKTAVAGNAPSAWAQQSSKSCNCGSSIAEARTLGCKFDALSMAWLPDHCRDDELTAEWDTKGSGPNGTWVYYADTAHKIALTREEVAAMGDNSSARAHMDATWHRIHCVYFWLRLQRSRTNGKVIEPRSDNEAHIMHCSMVFAEPGYASMAGVTLQADELEDD